MSRKLLFKYERNLEGSSRTRRTINKKPLGPSVVGRQIDVAGFAILHSDDSNEVSNLEMHSEKLDSKGL